MPTNNFFNPTRFMRLLQYDCSINKKKYLWILAGTFLIFFIVFYLFLYVNKWQAPEEFKTMYFVIFILCSPVVIFFVGSAFSDLSNPIKTQNFLMLPASILEKLLAQFVVHFLLFIPIALVVFWSAFYLAKAVLFTGHKEWQLQSSNYDQLPANMDGIHDNNFIPTAKAAINFQTTYIPDLHFNMLWRHEQIETISILVLLFLSLCIIFVGTVYFKRFALVKTTLLLAILVGVSLIGMYFLDEYLTSLIIPSQRPKVNMNYFSNAITHYPHIFLFWIGIGIILLSGFSYFKLKEKEA